MFDHAMQRLEQSAVTAFKLAIPQDGIDDRNEKSDKEWYNCVAATA